MTLVPSIAINQLLTPLTELQKAEVTLINYLEGVSQIAYTTPTNLGEENILIALQELQKAPTDYVVQVLSKLTPTGSPTQNITQNDVLVAVNLVQTYLQITSTLDDVLTTMAEIDSTNQDKYAAVKDARNALAKALVKVQTEPGFAEGEVDVEVLLQESQAILEKLKPFLKESFINISLFSQIVSQFVDHLGRAQSIFSILSSDDASLTALQIPDIQQLVQNWEAITGNLQTITANESSSEVQTNRASIAQSIQIHDRLEAVYDYLAEILRSNDLFNPAIL